MKRVTSSFLQRLPTSRDVTNFFEAHIGATIHKPQGSAHGKAEVPLENFHFRTRTVIRCSGESSDAVRYTNTSFRLFKNRFACAQQLGIDRIKREQKLL